MAFYTGYVLLPTNTYLAWKNAVAGNGYDADGFHGDQCWDLCAEFWYNVGFPTGYPLTGPNHSAYECWTVNNTNNISYGGTQYFDLVYDLVNVKQGDVVVFNKNADNSAGHIGFADEDYNINKNGYIAILGQNQGSGGIPIPVANPAGGTTANVKDLYAQVDFLGAFRFKAWHQHHDINTYINKKRFPWVLYANKLRSKNTRTSRGYMV